MPACPFGFVSLCIQSTQHVLQRGSLPRCVSSSILAFFLLFYTLTLNSLLLSLLVPAHCCPAGLVGVVLSFFSSLALHSFSFVSFGWWLDTTQLCIVILTVPRSYESSLAASLARMRCIPTQQPAECNSSGPAVMRKRRGVGQQRVITRNVYLMQTEYLEETGLSAEARNCAGGHSCSHPRECSQVYLYTWLQGKEDGACCHCFCFSAFDIVKAVQLLLWQAITFLFPCPSALFGG